MSRRSMGEVDSDIHLLDQRIRVQVELGMQGVLDIAKDIAHCCPDDEDLKSTARELMQEFIALEADVKLQVTALGQVKQMSRNMTEPSQEMPDPVRCLDQHLGQLEASGSSTDPQRHGKYKEMEQNMMVQDELKDEFNSLRSELLGHTEEDDVTLTQTEVNTRCPYSGRMMVNPVRNIVCGHVYDRDPILEHVKSRKGRAKCPVGGCTNATPIKPDLLEVHTTLKKYIDALQRRSQALSS